METIQQSFDKKYSEKKLEEIQFSDLNKKEISTGELTIENFPNLKKVNIKNIKFLTKLKIINCPQLVVFDCQDNNFLISLDLSECNKLMKIQVSNNHLDSIKLPTNSERLFHLEINDNNFPSQGLSFLAPYKNLEMLDLGNNSNEERVKKGIYNRFCGSLEPLKEMNNLWSLGIKGTDIDSGLEYLPENLQRFNCLTGVGVEAKVKKIYAICGASGSNNSSFGFDREKYKKFRQEQKIATEQVSSNSKSKKNKNAKQKEKLEIAHEKIKQLEAELQIEKEKKEVEWKRDILNQDLIEKQEEIEKLCAKVQGLNEQLTNSNGIIEEKDKKISELISENKKDKEEAKDLLSKKDKIEKELKEKIKSMEERINQLTEGIIALFQKNGEWEQCYQELEKLNDEQSKDNVRQRVDWKEKREEFEQIIDEEKTKNEVLQQQVAFYQDKLKTLQENLQNSHSSYTNFVNENLQIKKKEVEELTKQLNSLQNQVEVAPKEKFS